MNLTIAVDDEVLRRARIRALEEGSSVTTVLREHLESYAGATRRPRAAIARLLLLSKTARSGRGATAWTRDELHER